MKSLSWLGFFLILVCTILFQNCNGRSVGFSLDQNSSQASDGTVFDGMQAKIVVSSADSPMMPNKDPNGITCITASGQCSLLAALQVAGNYTQVYPGTAVLITVPDGFYSISSRLILPTGKISLLGKTLFGAILDGSTSTTGIMEIIPGTQALLQNLVFQNGLQSNTPTLAGGLTISGGQNVVIDSCVFSGNRSMVSAGEHLQALNVNNVTIKNTTFKNAAGGSTAAVYFENGKTVDMAGITIENNPFNGLVLQDTVVSVANSTIADSGGSGLVYNNVLGVASSVFKQVTLAENGGGESTGILVTPSTASAQLVFVNSIVSNVLRLIPICNGGVTLGNFASYSTFSDASCGTGGIGFFMGDPQLQALANNGGITRTMLPAPLSSVIDSGDTISCLPTDQRGSARPVDRSPGPGICDRGAIEL